MKKNILFIVAFTMLYFTQVQLFGQEQFTEQTTITFAGVLQASTAWGDYDNDGDLDLLLTGSNVVDQGISKIYRNNGNNTFSEQTAITLNGVYFGSAAWGDYDNDGDLDILLTGSTGLDTRVSKIYRNNGNNTFAEQTSISLPGVSESSVAWGDYNNDGDLDILLTGNTGAEYVSKIYYNNGNNTFTEQTSASLTGVAYSSVAWGDYDNDGDLDILLSGTTGTTRVTKIYQNNADNTFTEQTSIALAGVSYSAVAWGDYDNDGDLDILLSGSTGSNYVTKIYNNSGSNAFIEQTSIALIPVYNGSAAWGDYDNDGNLDIIITGNSGGDIISKIYHNEGNNTFTDQTTIGLTGVWVSSAGWGDYDNDGDLDVFLAGYTGSTSVSKLYRNNNITPNIVPSAPTGLSSNLNGQNVTLSWNKSTDGQTPQNGLRYNLVIGSSPNGVNILSPMSNRANGYRRVINLGNTSHRNSWTIKGLPIGTYYWSVQAIDNAHAGSSFSAEQSFTITPPPQFTEQTAIALTGVSNSSAAWGDYDNDGDLDILLTGNSGSGFVSKIYRNNGNNIFTEQTSIPLTGVYFSSAAWGDYDNDGDLDILLTGQITTGWVAISKIYKNNGDNTFTEQTSISLAKVGVSSVAWGDYDNDGDLDILLTGSTESGNVSKIYRNNGNHTFTEQTSISLTNVQWGSTSWGDYDNDGDLDILLTGDASSSFISKIYRNNGDNTFTEQTAISLIGVKGSAVAWGDYNNDGNMDILLAGQSSSGYITKIYRNNGDNTFTQLTSASLTGIRAGAVAWGDYDNDGDLDILLTGQTSSNYVSKLYKNNGDNTFTEQTSISLIGLFTGTVAWGDYDNDGDLDILLTGANGTISLSKIYRNNNLISNSLPTVPTNLNSTIIGQDVTFNWSKSTDSETPQNGLKYNLVIGTTTNGFDKLSPMSNRSTGYRRVINLGNTNHNNSWTIKGLPNGVYYWSVQALDNNFAGSSFAPERSFSIGPPMISWLDTLKITDNGIETGNLVYGQSYFATDSIDLLLGETSLPPTPPAGIFDVRFELPTSPNDYSLKDFRDDTLKAREWLIKFQPGSSGYPITFTWKSSNLSKGLFYLKDAVTGSIVNVNMKDNNSYTLTNSGITALKIEYSVVPVTWDAQILVKDKGNILQNLKFGQSAIATEGIDNALGELPLPPPPPTGSFDARFELPVVPADYSYVDYRNDTSKTITWLLKFQPGSEGYPFTFIWNPADLPEGFFYLRDNATGTVVNVNMKLTNSYTLANTGITSLKIEYSQQVCLNVNLNQGWNIVSVPVTAADMNTQTLFPGYTSPTYTYNNGYQPVITLLNGLGYWLRYGTSGTVNICGTQAGTNTIPVNAGWNIIGIYGQDVQVSAITSTPPSILTSPFYGFNNGYIQPSTLQIGKGYWIRASQNGVINLSTLLAKTNANPAVSNAIDPSWSKIVITDKEGKQGLVYLAKGNIDLKNYELPPIPPAGIFAVRYASDRNVELLNVTNEISINSANYPITVRADGIDIRITDSYSGTLIDRVLRNGESFVIEDNTINKLSVGEVDVPREYSLYQNYPNPFNPSTTIKFGLPENSNVVMTIYNQLGEKVETLIENNLEAGYHSITWNAGSLASGLYFYEIKTEKFTAVKKLLLMK